MYDEVLIDATYALIFKITSVGRNNKNITLVCKSYKRLRIKFLFGN